MQSKREKGNILRANIHKCINLNLQERGNVFRSCIIVSSTQSFHIIQIEEDGSLSLGMYV